jgi:hypothetical protein
VIGLVDVDMLNMAGATLFADYDVALNQISPIYWGCEIVCG